MKIRISFAVDIDPANWTLNYGITDPKEIRKDVREFAEEIVRSQFEVSGVPVR
jgi:predicted GTPase